MLSLPQIHDDLMEPGAQGSFTMEFGPVAASSVPLGALVQRRAGASGLVTIAGGQLPVHSREYEHGANGMKCCQRDRRKCAFPAFPNHLHHGFEKSAA
jgi:hypothetical protein